MYKRQVTYICLSPLLNEKVSPMIDAAIAAGADAAYLSGSGPTVAAITSGAAGDIFLQRTKERVDKQVTREISFIELLRRLRQL